MNSGRVGGMQQRWRTMAAPPYGRPAVAGITLHLSPTMCCMRTTVDLPDELLRQARARAAEEGRSLTSLLSDGLRLRLAAQPPAPVPGPLPLSRHGGGLAPGVDPARAESLLDAADAAR